MSNQKSKSRKSSLLKIFHKFTYIKYRSLYPESSQLKDLARTVQKSKNPNFTIQRSQLLLKRFQSSIIQPLISQCQNMQSPHIQRQSIIYQIPISHTLITRGLIVQSPAVQNPNAQSPDFSVCLLKNTIFECSI